MTTEDKVESGSKSKWLRLGIAGVALLFVLLYVSGIWYYSSHFLRGTRIGFMDVSGMTMEGISQKLEDYKLKVVGRDADGKAVETTIKGSAVGLGIGEVKEVEKILARQGNIRWLFEKGRTYQIDEFVTLDEKRLKEVVDGLPGMNSVSSSAPQDAYIERSQTEMGYEIIPEQAGNQLNRGKTMEAVRAALKGMEASLSLEDAGCYEIPAVLASNDMLVSRLEALNQATNLEIVYEFGENKEVLNGSLISDWISLDENGEVVLDREQVSEFVASLRKKYDSIFRPRKFMTSYGKEIRIDSGDYGWWMNYGQETTELYEMILRGESGTRVPEYYQTAAAYGEPDYGNTYVEINLTAQHMFYYEDGELILESDFVSGKPSTGNATPAGVYGITYKQRDATLVGEDYRTPVSYWMPFNKNIGLHDASWQSAFGGNRYLTHGSHGCINLPPSVAKELYGYVEKGTPIICYELAGTGTVIQEEVEGLETQEEPETVFLEE